MFIKTYENDNEENVVILEKFKGKRTTSTKTSALLKNWSDLVACLRQYVIVVVIDPKQGGRISAKINSCCESIVHEINTFFPMGDIADFSICLNSVAHSICEDVSNIAKNSSTKRYDWTGTHIEDFAFSLKKMNSIVWNEQEVAVQWKKLQELLIKQTFARMNENWETDIALVVEMKKEFFLSEETGFVPMFVNGIEFITRETQTSSVEKRSQKNTKPTKEEKPYHV